MNHTKQDNQTNSNKKTVIIRAGLTLLIVTLVISPFFLKAKPVIIDPADTHLSITPQAPKENAIPLTPITNIADEMVEETPLVEETEQLEVIKTGYVKPNTGNLNIRNGASTNHQIIGHLTDGDAVEIISLEDNWYKIKYDETVAYVSASYIMDTLPDLTEKVETPPSANNSSGFYENIITVTNTESFAVVVNKNNALSSDYVPSDLSVVNVTSVNGTVYLRDTAARAIESLISAASNEAGLNIYARSGYRSYQTQVDLYQRYVNANGREKADTFSARAGHSEHQTGLAIDVTADSVSNQLSDYFGETLEGQWINQNAHRFGFIVRYPKGKEDLTGYQYEPWHLRYVGVDIATVIYENDIILEQY